MGEGTMSTGGGQQAFETEFGVSVWESGMQVVVLTREAVFAKKFDSTKGLQGALGKIREGQDVKPSLGMLTKSFQLDAISAVSCVPTLGVLNVMGGKLKEPLRLTFPHVPVAREIFERLRRELGSDLPVETAKAGMNDVPLDPSLVGTLVFAIVAVALLVAGALTTGPIGGGGRVPVLGQIGQWLGPIPVFAIAAVALGFAIYSGNKWRKTLPEKVVVRRQ